MTAGVTGIQRIDGVLSAALVYQCADSLDAMNEEIPMPMLRREFIRQSAAAAAGAVAGIAVPAPAQSASAGGHDAERQVVARRRAASAAPAAA